MSPEGVMEITIQQHRAQLRWCVGERALVGRTLLSVAFDFDFDFDLPSSAVEIFRTGFSTMKNNTNCKIQGDGQECPSHPYCVT